MMLIIIGLMALFSFIPLLMSVCMSLKPINELFYYPPRIFPERPTFDNFRMLFNLMKTTWVPFERYAFNTVFITLATTAGHVMLASMAAYPLAKMKIPFVRLFNNLILISLMFVSAINDIANYLTITWFGWLDTYLAVIVPSIGASLGLFIMKNYMSTIPDTLLEAARIDGCSESGIQKYQTYSGLYTGLYAILGDSRERYNAQKRFMLYRFHVKDAIYFDTAFSMKMDNLGWTGPRYDDYTSTAYWYLDKPAALPFILPSDFDLIMR